LARKNITDVNEARLYADGEQPEPMTARWRIAVMVAMIAALALLALVVAHWGWAWFGPQSVALPRPAVDPDPVRTIREARLFGSAAPASVAAAPAATGELRLLGLVSERNGRGYALFRTPRGPALVAAGQEVSPGVRVESVRRDGVTLTENGARRDIDLREAKTASSRAAAPAKTAVAAAPVKSAAAAVRPSGAATSAACAAPAGFSGPVVRLNAELLTGMMTTTDAWKALVEPGQGALVVRDQSGFASNLGLKNGDRVESANGVALAVPADIPSMVLEPLTRSQPVWLAGSRDGKAQHWLYLNAGACPG
jgi:hypothetical protein